MISKNEAKYIQSLYRKKNRDANEMFIAEGPKLIDELLQSDFIIKKMYATDEWIENNTASIPVISVTSSELQRISNLETPNKVLAIVEKKKPKIPSLANKITIALDGLQDPGNLGTIIRIADWFGVEDIIASGDTADVYNPKVVQSTMGSLIRVNIFYTDLNSFLKDVDVTIYGALLDGKNIYEMKPMKEGIILIGNESKGVQQDLLKLASHRITIPKAGQAESLNAAVAAGIILSQILKTEIA